MDHEEYPASEQEAPQIDTVTIAGQPATLSYQTQQYQRKLNDESEPSWFWHSFIGVLLPVFALGIELASGIWADALFDPIPTLWHVGAIALVPIANALALMLLHKEAEPNPRTIFFLNGMAQGVAGMYALFFLPLFPAALIGVIYFGLGLLPLSPYTSLLSAIILGRALRKKFGPQNSFFDTRVRWGIIAGITLLCILELPSFFTNVAMKLAVSESNIARDRGLALLRTFGSEDAMIRACYWNQQTVDPWGAVAEIFFGYKRVKTDEARTLFYRTTGIPFNNIKPPTDMQQSNFFDGLEFDSDLDADHGGEIVGGQIKGLSLNQSRIDAVVDGIGATSYQEWVLVFKNDADVAREARTQIQLPPGGVVSRLTLWVNGVECEAAFSGVNEVRSAYKAVAVVERRDPVLVTSCGPDRIMMQCFPVPADGGEMKVRIGISAPLEFASATQAGFHLPRIIERNFGTDDLSHTVWIESGSPLHSGTDSLTNGTKGSKHIVHGSLDHSSLIDRSAYITVDRSSTDVTWANDPYDSTRITWQRILPVSTPHPDEIAIVVDASAGMEDAIDDVAQAIAALPDDVRLRIMVAEDNVREVAAGRLDAALRETIIEELDDIDAEGGRDNTPALVQAWDSLTAREKSAIVWIHAAQPVALSSVDPLVQRFERLPNGPKLYDYQVGTGPNRTIEALGREPSVRVMQPMGTVEQDLTKLFGMVSGRTRELLPERFSTRRSRTLPHEAQASSHIARLWAVDTVAALLRERKATDAGVIAAAHQLVTPVSGAVVLESAAQYARANLKPVDPETVPTVPEPEEWLMIAIAALVTGWMIYRKRRSPQWQSA